MDTPPASPLSARSLYQSPHAPSAPPYPHEPESHADDDQFIDGSIDEFHRQQPPSPARSPVQPQKITELVNALAQADAKYERQRVIAENLRVDLDAAG